MGDMVLVQPSHFPDQAEQGRPTNHWSEHCTDNRFDSVQGITPARPDGGVNHRDEFIRSMVEYGVHQF